METRAAALSVELTLPSASRFGGQRSLYLTFETDAELAAWDNALRKLAGLPPSGLTTSRMQRPVSRSSSSGGSEADAVDDRDDSLDYEMVRKETDAAGPVVAHGHVQAVAGQGGRGGSASDTSSAPMASTRKKLVRLMSKLSGEDDSQRNAH